MKLYLSGGERYGEVLHKAGVPFVLCRWEEPTDASEFWTWPHLQILVRPGETGPEEDFEKYRAFLQQNHSRCRYAEFDRPADPETKNRWRGILLGEGLQPILTYRFDESEEGFVRLCRDRGVKQIGLSPKARTGRTTLAGFFSRQGDFLADHGIEVHLWGCSDRDLYGSFPIASCDSMGWLAGLKYGQTHVWRPGYVQMQIHKPTQKHLRQGLSDLCQAAGVDHKQFVAGEDAAVLAYHAYVWGSYARWLHPEAQATPSLRTRSQSNRSAVPRRCDTCVIKDRCPEFQSGEECAFPQSIDFADTASLTKQVVGMALARLEHALLVERLTNGHIDPNVTKEFRAFFEVVQAFQDLEPQGKIGGKKGVLSKLVS